MIDAIACPIGGALAIGGLSVSSAFMNRFSEEIPEAVKTVLIGLDRGTSPALIGGIKNRFEELDYRVILFPWNTIKWDAKDLDELRILIGYNELHGLLNELVG